MTACVSCSKFASVRTCTSDWEGIAAEGGLPEEAGGAGAAGAAARAKGRFVLMLLRSCQAAVAASRHKTRKKDRIFRNENIDTAFSKMGMETYAKDIKQSTQSASFIELGSGGLNTGANSGPSAL